MASKITYLLVTVTVILLVTSLVLMSQKEEGFANPAYTVKNLEINACPIFANEIQTSKGNTDCCQGDMVDGKCNGKTFCTKSPAYKGIPGCVDAWREYFQKKGNDFCPPTMMNYYEDISKPTGLKGCSAGPITKDGKQPADGTKSKCKIYVSEMDNKTRLDSCYLEKERMKIQCPVVNGKSPQATMMSDQATKKFQMFACQYPFELGMPDKCFEKKSFFMYMDTTNKNWRMTKDGTSDANKQICDNFIAKRNAARDELIRVEAERRRREAAEAREAKLKSSLSKFTSLFKKSQTDNSRLQQQLDEANRRAQQCKK